MIRHVRTIDAHVAGDPVRLAVDGFPAPHGETLQEKRGWLRKHADALRRALVLEPRGHQDMSATLLTGPATPQADAGILFMHGDGYATLGIGAIIAATTIALERGLLVARYKDDIVFDSPAGQVHARPTMEMGTGAATPRRARARASRAYGSAESHERVSRVAVTGVPSFVYRPGVPLKVGMRALRADVAFGGVFYAIVDAEAAGLAIEPASLPELRRMGIGIARAAEAVCTAVHPLDPSVSGIYGTVFIGPAHAPNADLRNVTIFGNGQAHRSPSGTGMAAVMAVLDAMSMLPSDRPIVQESIIGTRLQGQVAGRVGVGEFQAIVPEVEGTAWITGEHEFLIDDQDPLAKGFLP